MNVSTVSKALNNSPEISESKREEIKAIARELNYLPNLSARALVGKRSNSIGVILPEIRSNYYATMFNHIEEAVNGTGLSLIMGTTNFNVANEIRYLNVLSSRQVDGIILIASMHGEIEESLNLIAEKYNIPILLIESFIDSPSHDYIMIDNRYGINLAIKYFKQCKHERIGFISETISARTRLPWFRETMKENGYAIFEKFIKIGEERFELGGYLRMKELLQQKTAPDAVFVSYDHMAIGAMKAAYELGFRIPEDIAIIGFDNIRESEYLYKPLSTISPPIKEMVQIGMNLLSDRMNNTTGSAPQHITLKPTIFLRGTTKTIDNTSGGVSIEP